MRPCGLQPGVVGYGRAVQGFEAQRAGDVGHVGSVFGLEHRQAAKRGHQGGAVGQRQALFGLEGERRQAGGEQGLAARHDLPVDLGLAQADQDQRHMRQGRQVAAGAERALARDNRVDAAFKHAQQQLDDLGPAAGVAFGQRVGADQHHGAHHRRLQWPADADGVAHDDVALQLGGLLGVDEAITEGAEAGGDAIDHLTAGDEILDGLAGPGYPAVCLGCQFNALCAGLGGGYRHHVFDG